MEDVLNSKSRLGSTAKILFGFLSYVYKSRYFASSYHYANKPMLYTAIFHGCKNVNFRFKNIIFFLFLLITLIVGTLNEAFLMSARIYVLEQIRK